MRLLISILLLPLTVYAETEQEYIAPEYIAKVISVYDGDTIEVEVKVWEKLYTKNKVRLRHIQAPEMDGNCKMQAILARDRLQKLAGKKVYLTDVDMDGFGRILATVYDQNHTPIHKMMLREDLVIPYKPKTPFCNE